jgi:DNA-binding NtrC family response regulator
MSGVVLIVEDEAQVLILAESVLQGAGYETASASTVAEALAIIESDRHIDLLFTDLGLGNDAEGGLTIGAAFSKSRPGVPVLYTSARGLTDGMSALFVEPHGFVAKPYNVEQLIAAVAKLIQCSKDT